MRRAFFIRLFALLVSSMAATSAKVNVKWGKQRLVVDVDLEDTLEVFQSQLYSLTGVPAERQKMMLRGKMLKGDETSLARLGLVDGVQLSLMGSADTLMKQVEKIVFMEDIAGDSDDALAAMMFPPGLTNLGNTCYLNATLQCLRTVPEFADSLLRYRGSIGETDLANNLTCALRDLFVQLNVSKQAVAPFALVGHLRRAFPQFAQQTEQGHPIQQDAEECLMQLLSALAPKLGPSQGVEGSRNVIDDLFGIEVTSTMTCPEAPDEPPIVGKDIVRKVACHIGTETRFMFEGIQDGLTEPVTKQSEFLGRDAEYVKTTKLNKLPKFMFVQFVRFFWKSKEKIKAKIVKSVNFPLQLDVYDLCSDELKMELNLHRKSRVSEEPGDDKGKEKQEEQEETPSSAPTGGQTGRYELCGVVTHQGRSADGGHYVGWVKQQSDWLKFDDERVSSVASEEVKKLSGGGDWHTAYLLLYKSTE